MTARARFTLLAVFALALLGGCEDDFDPRGDGPPFFAVFGVLDGFAETQLLRVEDVMPPIDSMVTTLDARATLTDLATGTTTTGRDTTLVLFDGSLGFAVLFDQPVEAGRTYTFAIERLTDPAARTTAEIPVDGPPPLVASSPNLVGTFYTQLVRLSTPDRTITDVRVEYRLVRTETGEAETFSFSLPINTLTSGVSVTVPLTSNLMAIRNALNLDPSDTESLALRQIALRFTQTRRGAGLFRDGLGEIGWRVPAEGTWTLDAATLDALGLVDAQGG